ncbi:MAG: hypothetical protein RL033_2745 [Pseudomonadota bacterium]
MHGRLGTRRCGLAALLAGLSFLTRQGLAADAPAPLAVAPALAAPPSGAAAAQLVDRVVARFTAPETGGTDRPRFIFERELAFEARLEALVDASFVAAAASPFLDRHVRSALERHMAETLLESLEITPEPSLGELQVRMRSVRLALVEQVGGEGALTQLLLGEGLDPSELTPLLARRARATLYLDRMVATMLTPSDTELRIVHRTTRTPFSAQPYEAVSPLLARWYVGQRLNSAVRAFYEGARSRITVSLAQLPQRVSEAEE